MSAKRTPATSPSSGRIGSRPAAESSDRRLRLEVIRLLLEADLYLVDCERVAAALLAEGALGQRLAARCVRRRGVRPPACRS